MAKTKHQEPAYKSYFFGASYAELWATIRESWHKNWADVSDSFRAIPGSWGRTGYGNRFLTFYKAFCMTILHTAILIAVSVFGTLYTAIFSFLHILLLGTLMLLVYIGFVFLRSVDTLYRLGKGIATNCYNPGCERKFSLPIYICPSCHNKHYRLVPSKYGIFRRKCKCGTLLPTTFFNGRQKLDSLCPHCEHPAIKGMHKSLLIPVIGGASAGKTCFISMSISQIEKEAERLGLTYEYQTVAGDEYHDNMQNMNNGICPQKTNDMEFKYYNFYLTPKGQKITNLISVCDVAGEIFANQSSMITQQGYRFADGLLVVIDPLSIFDFNKEIKQKLKQEEYDRINGSTQLLNDILSGLINTMEALYHAKATDEIKTTLVVVFTKSDIPGLDEKIGEKAIRAYRDEHADADYCTASNAVCQDFLEEYNESSFLHTVKGKFRAVQFFSCSALGKQSKDGKFHPVNVEKPLLWLIGKMNKTFDVSAQFDADAKGKGTKKQ